MKVQVLDDSLDEGSSGFTDSLLSNHPTPQEKTKKDESESKVTSENGKNVYFINVSV